MTKNKLLFMFTIMVTTMLVFRNSEYLQKLIFSFVPKTSYYRPVVKHVVIADSKFYKFKISNLTKDQTVLKESCWKNLSDANKNDINIVSPHQALCLFKPLKVNNDKRFPEKIVVLGIGVHLGPAADNKEMLPKAGFKYISWEYRDKRLNGLQEYLIAGYSKQHLKLTQEKFWNAYWNDPELMEADIIVCGFDVWHCLIFAPFNKKIVINSNYRFDGHIATSDKDMIDLQNELYAAVRYNPDVIMAGSIIYDVMYQQHFLGSHKMIPVPASCEYVQHRVEKEVEENIKCTNECKKTSNKTIILIFPKRLSDGGWRIAKDLKLKAGKNEQTFEIKYFHECFPSGYRYCQLGMFIYISVD